MQDIYDKLDSMDKRLTEVSNMVNDLRNVPMARITSQANALGWRPMSPQERQKQLEETEARNKAIIEARKQMLKKRNGINTKSSKRQ